MCLDKILGFVRTNLRISVILFICLDKFQGCFCFCWEFWLDNNGIPQGFVRTNEQINKFTYHFVVCTNKLCPYKQQIPKTNHFLHFSTLSQQINKQQLAGSCFFCCLSQQNLSQQTTKLRVPFWFVVCRNRICPDKQQN